MTVSTAFKLQRRSIRQTEGNRLDTFRTNHSATQPTVMAAIGDGEGRRTDVACRRGDVALPRDNRLFILAKGHLVTLRMVIGQLLQSSFQPRRLNLAKVLKFSAHLDKISK